MTVERMIKELQKMNPKATVKMHHFMGEAALFVLTAANNKNDVWIESASDNDMKSEIEARFQYAEENKIDELDFYKDMLEIGIDVDMVRKYMGNEKADYMQKFFISHNLYQK